MIQRARLATILTWAIIFLAALFIVVTSLVDRCSKHAEAWVRQTMDIPSVKLSDGE